MTLDRADVAELAWLARLALPDAELDALRGDLEAILAHVAALAEVDTEGVEPMTHPVPQAAPLRPDVVAPSLPAELALRGAPAVADDAFEVPHVLERATE